MPDRIDEMATRRLPTPPNTGWPLLSGTSTMHARGRGNLALAIWQALLALSPPQAA